MTPAMRMAKRALDVTVSVAGMLLLTPVLILIAILVRVDSPGPVFYLAQRVGRNGKPFTMYKFRSMFVDSPVLHNTDGTCRVDRDDPRVTRVGRVLRIGLDELPQLFNVLRGDMSLIGPRPDPPEALAHYDEEERRRLVVRPGITGLAQVAGRTDIPWRKRLRYDLAYVDAQSLRLDGWIALRTLFEFTPVLRRRWPGWRRAYEERTGEEGDQAWLPLLDGRPVRDGAPLPHSTAGDSLGG